MELDPEPFDGVASCFTESSLLGEGVLVLEEEDPSEGNDAPDCNCSCCFDVVGLVADEHLSFLRW